MRLTVSRLLTFWGWRPYCTLIRDSYVRKSVSGYYNYWQLRWGWYSVKLEWKLSL